MLNQITRARLNSDTSLQLSVVFVIVLSVLLRIWAFASGRSLWLDEAMVALSIVSLPLTALLGPLEFNQLAPFGWLVLEKLSYNVSKEIDYSLRAVSLVAGLGSVFFFWRLCLLAFGSWETLVGVALFGLNSSLIANSAMVKPYILDALFSIVLLYLALSMLRDPTTRPRGTILFAVAGLVCLPLSFGGVISMAATGLVLFGASVVQADRRWSLSLVVTGCIWILGLGVIYSLFYAQQTTTVGNMTTVFWGSTFAPMPTSLAALIWYPKALAGAMNFIVSDVGFKVLIVFFLFGCFCIGRKEPWLLALIITPFIVALLVSGFKAYPFSTRFLLFLAPPLILTISAGLVAAARSFRQPAVAAIGLLTLFGSGPLLSTASSAMRAPAWPNEEITINLKYLAQNYQPGDQIVLSLGAERAYLLYSQKFALSKMPYVTAHYYRNEPTCVYADVRTIESAKRSWIIFYHVVESDADSINFLMRALGHSGRISVANAAPGSTLYFYEAAPVPQSGLILPSSAAVCSEPREGRDFLEAIASKQQSR